MKQRSSSPITRSVNTLSATYPSTDLFVPPLTFHATLNGSPVKVLLDTGATEDCISSSSSLLKTLQLKDSKESLAIEAVDGRIIPATQRANGSLSINFGTSCTKDEEVSLLIVPLAHSDIILGTPWMTKNKININMATREVSPIVEPHAEDCHGALPGHATAAEVLHAQDKTSFVSRHRIANAARTLPLFMAVVRKADDGNGGQDSSGQSFDASLAANALKEEYKELFLDDLPPGPPPHRKMVHRIDEKDGALPVHGPIYRLSEKELETLRGHLKTELEAGRIQPSCSPYGSPVLFVPKKDGKLRLCIDYRALNKQTIKNRYPLPRVDDLLDQLRHAKVFSKIDLKSGYNQVKIHPEHTHKTAFKTRYGHYEYLVMPFGLCNAPATFQQLMNDVLRPFLDRLVIVYLDDILIYSPNKEQHEKDVRQVMEKLREHQLFVAPNKCEFFRTQTEFLGHIVSDKGVSMDPAKIKAITEFPVCANVHDIQSFLGTANFYRRFIKDFSKVAQPLTELLHKDKIFEWKEPQDQAMAYLKERFTTAPILRIFNSKLPIRVSTDASDFGIGAVLEQEFEDNQWHPIAFESRKMTPAERNYPIREKELLAVVHALTTWRLYLEDSPGFQILTDHYSLKYLDTQKTLNKRQARWQELLCNFNFEVKPIPGKVNSVPDSLSRRSDYKHINVISTATSDLAKQIKEATKESELYELYKHPRLPKTVAQRTILTGLKEADGYLKKDQRIFVPTVRLQRIILDQFHDSPMGGHLGQDKTLEAIQRTYYWPDMENSIRHYISHCDMCQRIKPATHKPYGLLQSLPIPNAPWESVSMDYITELPPSRGFTGIMTVVDRLTKMAHFLPCNMEGLTAVEAAHLFMRVVGLHGVPKEIVSDRDPRFTSYFWRALWKTMGVKLNMSTAHHAQTDGQTERAHRTLNHILRAHCNYQQDNWVDLLPMAEFAFNNTASATTGVSPFFANTGRHPAMPVDLATGTTVEAAAEHVETLRKVWEDLKVSIKKATERQARYADQRRQEMTFDIGDQVLLNTTNLRTTQLSRKLAPQRIGPCKVIAKVGEVAYKLTLPPGLGQVHPVFHVSLLEPYRQPIAADRTSPPPPHLLDDDGDPEVEAILEAKWNGVSKEWLYLVKWKHWPLHDATWTQAKDLKNAGPALEAYRRQNEHGYASQQDRRRSQEQEQVQQSS